MKLRKYLNWIKRRIQDPNNMHDGNPPDITTSLKAQKAQPRLLQGFWKNLDSSGIS